MIDRATTALEQGQTHYAEVPGIDPLREKLATYIRQMGLVGYEPANILVTAGIQECRFLAIQMVGERFGCIGLPEVVHPGVRQAVGVRPIDVRPLAVDRTGGLLPTLSSLEATLEEGCKLLYLESPARLTGAIYDATSVTRIAELLDRFDAAAIWDQGLAPWVPQAQYISLGSQPGMAERVVVLGETWPGIGLESWFIGYIGANTDWLESMRSQKQIMSICTSTPSQYAALQAADLYPDWHDAQLESLAEIHHKARGLAQEVGATPLTGTTVNIVALQVSDPEQIRAALRQAGFEVGNGTAFGAPDVLRLTITPDNAIARALNQLA